MLSTRRSGKVSDTDSDSIGSFSSSERIDGVDSFVSRCDKLCLQNGAKTSDIDDSYEDTSSNEDSNTEEFTDASDNLESESEMEASERESLEAFERQLQEASDAFTKVVNNEYKEGFKAFSAKADVSMYHALGRACMHIITDFFTLKKDKMQKTVDDMKKAFVVVDKYRKKSTVSSVMWRSNYDDYTDIEVHAELVLAKISAIYAFVILLTDLSISGFVRSAVKIRASFKLFKECQKILETRQRWSSKVLRDHFASGVHMGIGGFDMAISYFPTKFIKLLEFAGFSGDRNVGIRELKKCAAIKGGFMHPLVAVILSINYGFLEYFYSLGETDVSVIREIHSYYLKKTPQSIAVTFGSAFLAQHGGHFDEACNYYTDFVHSQDTMKAFHYLSYWQKCWLYAAQWDFKPAAENAKFLLDNWKFSPAMFAYMYAAFSSMLITKDTPHIKSEVSAMLRKVPSLKRTFGGKKAFHEKLVIARSQRFAGDVDNFLLAPLDLMYLWNVFAVAAGNESCLPRILAAIEDKLKVYQRKQNVDSYAYLVFMKGVCYSHSGCPLLAMQCFYEVLDMERDLTRETQLPPQACFEIGMTYRRANDKEEAKKWLKKTRNYSGYVTETAICFRSQCALISLQES
ncbi:Tetratricopeptide repeat protein 39B [Halotydeus destructor]|nr:Tetratricopeptide repeat protein 39B [Halotydeus destructor]